MGWYNQPDTESRGSHHQAGLNSPAAVQRAPPDAGIALRWPFTQVRLWPDTAHAGLCWSSTMGLKPEPCTCWARGAAGEEADCPCSCAEAAAGQFLVRPNVCGVISNCHRNGRGQASTLGGVSTAACPAAFCADPSAPAGLRASGFPLRCRRRRRRNAGEGRAPPTSAGKLARL